MTNVYKSLNLYSNEYSPKFNNLKVEFDNTTATYKPSAAFRTWLEQNFRFEPKSIIALAQSKQMESSNLQSECWREDFLPPEDGSECWKYFLQATPNGVYTSFCNAINYLKDFVYINQIPQASVMLYVINTGRKQPAAIIGAEVKNNLRHIKPKDISYSVGFNPYCSLGKLNPVTQANLQK